MIERFPVYFSPSSDERMVSVYLPEGYAESDEAYPVMYMFDGQNAFEDSAASYGKSWRLHTFMDGWHKRMIVVGLQSSPEGRSSVYGIDFASKINNPRNRQSQFSR